MIGEIFRALLAHRAGILADCATDLGGDASGSSEQNPKRWHPTYRSASTERY